MRHRKKGKILGREKAPRKALLRSLATSFIVYEKIKTTVTKAKVMRPIVEKLITLGKADTVTRRREAKKTLYLEGAIKKLFEVVGPKYQTRKGGYTRIVKVGARKSDGADMAILEMVNPVE